MTETSLFYESEVTNSYLHYVFVAFQRATDARRFWESMRERLLVKSRA